MEVFSFPSPSSFFFLPFRRNSDGWLSLFFFPAGGNDLRRTFSSFPFLIGPSSRKGYGSFFYSFKERRKISPPFLSLFGQCSRKWVEDFSFFSSLRGAVTGFLIRFFSFFFFFFFPSSRGGEKTTRIDLFSPFPFFLFPPSRVIVTEITLLFSGKKEGLVFPPSFFLFPSRPRTLTGKKSYFLFPLRRSGALPAIHGRLFFFLFLSFLQDADRGSPLFSLFFSPLFPF